MQKEKLSNLDILAKINVAEPEAFMCVGLSPTPNPTWCEDCNTLHLNIVYLDALFGY